MTQLEFLRREFPLVRSMTAKQALENYGIADLAKRVCEMQDEGYVFTKLKREVPTRYTRAKIVVYVLQEVPKKRGA